MKSEKDPQQESDFPQKIGSPARSALHEAGYTRLDQLTQVSEAELLKLHGMGPKALGILRQTLSDKGMAFAPAKKPEKKTVKKTPESE